MSDLIPQGCLPILEFTIAAFYSPDGDMGYQLYLGDDAESQVPSALLIGLLEMVKADLIAANQAAG